MHVARQASWIMAACALQVWLAPAATAADFIDSAALHSAGLSRYWQLQLSLAAEQRLADAFLVDDRIYATTVDGYVFAVHAHTGALLWVRQVTTGGYRLNRPCHALDRVVFVTPSSIVQLQRDTGQPVTLARTRRTATGRSVTDSQILQPVSLRFPAATGAISDGRLMVLGGFDRRFYAFRLNQSFEEWKAGVAAPVTSTPALLGDDLFVADEAGRVYCCKFGNKALRWITQTTGPVSADLYVDNNGVYVASQDQSLWLFDLQFGAVRWRARLHSPLLEAPVIALGLAYQFSPADGLVAVETAPLGVAERVRWTLPAGRALLSVDADRAFVLSQNQSLFVVRQSDGSLLQEVPATGFSLPMPSPEQAAVYVASPDGRLFCARPLGVPPLRAEDVIASRWPRRPAARESTSAPQPVGPTRPDDLLGVPAGYGLPLGGKSRISRDWVGGREPASPAAPPATRPAGGRFSPR